MARLSERRANPNPNTPGIMNSGSDQRSRGRYNGNRPFQQQQRPPQRSQTFDSNGPNAKIRGSAHQIFERYIALAREAAIGGDRVAAEKFLSARRALFARLQCEPRGQSAGDAAAEHAGRCRDKRN
jgi:hypothetical protein